MDTTLPYPRIGITGFEYQNYVDRTFSFFWLDRIVSVDQGFTGVKERKCEISLTYKPLTLASNQMTVMILEHPYHDFPVEFNLEFIFARNGKLDTGRVKPFMSEAYEELKKYFSVDELFERFQYEVEAIVERGF